MSRANFVHEAVDRFLARVRKDTDRHLETLAAELLHVVEGDGRTSRVDLERAAVDVARAVAKGGSQARHDLITRVVDALRRLDDATTLKGIIDALALGAAAEASRVAVLMVDGVVLRSWGHRGFAAGGGPPDLPLDASSLFVSAVTLRQVVVVPYVGDATDQSMPVFMRLPKGHTGLLMPLVVGREVVALIYADGPDRQEQDAGAPVWIEQVEVLVRHASSRLENVTSRRTVEVLTAN